MVDLPFPNVNPVLAEEPTGRADPSVFKTMARPGIASGIEAIAQGVGAIASKAKESEEDFSADVQRKPDGSLEVIQRDAGHFLFDGGETAAGVMHANKVGTLAAGQTMIDEEVTKLRHQFIGKPAEFNIAVGQYADSLRQKYEGPLGDVLWSHAVKLGSQHHLSEVNASIQNTLQASYKDTLIQVDSVRNDILNFSRGSNATDPTAVEKTKEWQTVENYYRSLSDNPKFSKEWTPVKVDAELAHLKDAARYEWVMGNAQRMRDEKGPDAAAKWIDDNVSKAASFSPEERDKYRAVAIARVQELTEQQRANKKISEESTRALATQLKSGYANIDDASLAGVIANARRNYNYEGAAELEYLRSARQFTRVYTRLNPQAGVGAATNPAATMPVFSSGASGANAAAMLRKFEGFREGAYWDVNHWRAGYGSDTVTRADGRVETVTAFTRVTREDAERDLARRAGEFQSGIQAKVGADAWGRLDDGTKASLTSVAYNYGSLPDRVAEAVRSGDKERIAQAVYGLRGDNAGVNAKRREQEAAVIRGAPIATGPNSPVPFTPEQIRDNPAIGSMIAGMASADRRAQAQYARDQIETMERGIEMGVPPSEEQMAEVIQIARANPALADKVESLWAKFNAAPLAVKAAGMLDGGAAAIALAEERARQSPDLYHMNVAKAVADMTTARAKAFKDDPHEYAARSDVGWIDKKPTMFQVMAAPKSIGAETPQQVLATAIQERREAGIRIANKADMSATEAMFTAGDIKTMASILQRTDGAGASMFLRGLEGNLRPEELQTLAQNKEFAGAVAGLTRSGDPAKVGAGFGFLDKQARQNFEAFKKDYGGDMANKLAVWQDKIAFMGPDQATKELMRWNDPAYERAKKELRDVADHDLKDATPSAVVSKVWGSYIPFTSPSAPVSDDGNIGASAVGMLADYRSAYRDIYAESGDRAISEKRAAERVQLKWGKSEINGGRVMAYPPEGKHADGTPYYPLVGGSTDYIKNQLENGIDELAKRYAQEAAAAVPLRSSPAQGDGGSRATTPGAGGAGGSPGGGGGGGSSSQNGAASGAGGASPATPVSGGAGARVHVAEPSKLRSAARVLVSDDLTQEDIANRLPPSYRVMYQDDAARWHVLESKPGVPLRFRADAKAAQDSYANYFARARSAHAETEAAWGRLPIIADMADAWRGRPRNTMVQPPPVSDNEK